MMARGPSRVPARAVTVESYGTGSTTTRDRSNDGVLLIERGEVHVRVEALIGHGVRVARVAVGG